MLRIVRDLLVIMVFAEVGRGLTSLLPFSFPGSIIGMLMLFVALSAGWIKLSIVEAGAGVLIKYMAVMFVPIGVGLIGYIGLLEHNAAAFLVSTFVSTFVSMAVVGGVYQRLRS